MRKLMTLYARTIELHRQFQSERWLVPNSIPILHFGNVKQYFKSNLKIVTVGLNPSNAEFAEDRFGIHSTDQLSPADLERALSAYFEKKPYSKWFNGAFETLLQPLGASYYGETYPYPKKPGWWEPRTNRALHTDICTPLATTPTWSRESENGERLPTSVKRQLREIGVPLWRALMEVLEPHLILISVSRGLRDDGLGQLSWRSFPPFDNAGPEQELQIARLGKSSVVWGQPQIRPFFHLPFDQRSSAADAILSEVFATPSASERRAQGGNAGRQLGQAVRAGEGRETVAREPSPRPRRRILAKADEAKLALKPLPHERSGQFIQRYLQAMEQGRYKPKEGRVIVVPRVSHRALGEFCARHWKQSTTAKDVSWNAWFLRKQGLLRPYKRLSARAVSNKQLVIQQCLGCF
jgi:hypothetical protein